MNLESLKKNIEEIGRALPQDKIFKKPTLFIKGGNSNYITEEDEAKIKRQFPSSEIKEIANAGHWVHAEKMNDFYNVLLDFL